MFVKKHFRIKFKRVIIVLTTIILGLLLTYLVMSDSDSVVELRYEEAVESGVIEVHESYQNYLDKIEMYQDYLEDCVENIAGLEAYYYEKNGFSGTTKNEVYRMNKDYGYQYYYLGGVNEETGSLSGFMVNDPRLACELTEDELKELFEEGYYLDENGRNYTCQPVEGKGYVFIGWRSEEVVKPVMIADNYEYESGKKTILKIDGDTDIIVDANDKSLIGTNVEDLVSLNIIKQVNGDGRFVDLKDGRGAYLYSYIEDDGTIFASFMSFRYIAYLYARACAVPVVVGFVTLLLIMFYVLKFNRAHTKDEKSEIAYLHIYKDIYTDGRLVYHTIALSLFAIILVVSATLYVHLLINYSNNSIKTDNDLNALVRLCATAEEDCDNLIYDYGQTQKLIINNIADYFLNYPEQLKEKDTISNMMNSLPGVSSVTLFNNTGTIEHDSSEHVGYTLSHDELSPEYICWELIDGRSDLVHYTQDKTDYYAGRRQDKDGIIRIAVSNERFDQYIDNYSVGDILDSVKIGSDIKGYVDLTDTSKLHYLLDNQGDMKEAENVFEEEIISGVHAKTDIVDGNRYMIDSKIYDDYVFFIGKNVATLYGSDSVNMLLKIVVIFILQQIVIIIIGMRVKTDTPEKIIDIRESIMMAADDLNEKIMDDSFRKIIRNMFLVTSILVIVMLLVDLRYGTVPVIQFLFGSKWEKGINLYSITMLLIIAIGGALASRILQSVILLFTANMGPRGLTIGRMASSVVKFAFLIAVAILMLMNVGVNPGTLLAGAGIIGAMLSFCAQQTVNDMLSGFLIVFENLFNIGDWITVDDFRGQVCEIGIRTTKLRISDTYKIFNNSELRKITIMEENGRGAICFVDIAYKEDINRVIDLINGSTDRYRKEIPEITKGPKVDGVLNLGDSGVTVRFWAHSDISKVYYVERELRRVTKNLLDENGIEIPFNQVTIHEAK